MIPKFQTYYNMYHKDNGTEFDPNGSLTDQDFKMTTDVNYLLEHMAGHSRTPIYGIQDTRTFEDWSNEMALVKRRFLRLDEETRKQFGTAQKFLEWCANPQNYEEMLPSVIAGRVSKEKLERDKSIAEQKSELYAQKLAQVLKNKE